MRLWQLHVWHAARLKGVGGEEGEKYEGWCCYPQFAKSCNKRAHLTLNMKNIDDFLISKFYFI